MFARVGCKCSGKVGSSLRMTISSGEYPKVSVIRMSGRRRKGRSDEMNEVRTNEKLLEVHNVDMGTVQRRPYWGCAAMVCDANEKGSLLWWWARWWVRMRSFDFSFSFFDIGEMLRVGETFVMGGGPGPERRRPS
jgi:hypothetical protein